ncbi:MAG: DNA-processing protein DprA [Acidimicrobiia bacterium]
MILGPYEFGPAPKIGLRLMFRGDFRYVQVLQEAFPSPTKWYGPYEAYEPRYGWVLYGHDVDERSLGLFLEFASTAPFIPTTLDECWVLSMHMGEGGRTPVGELVYNAKTYAGKPGDLQAAEQLCEIFVEQIRRHPPIQRADGIVGVPANPPKSPHNLPELLVERASTVLGIPLERGLVEKLKPTDIKNLPRDTLAWSALKSTPRLGPKRLAELAIVLGQRHQKGGELLDAGVEDLESLGLSRSLAEKAAQTLSDPPEADPAPAGSVLLTPDDTAYPSEHLDPRLPLPVLLYVSGNVRLLRRPGIAISGSRSAARPATELAAHIARSLAEMELNVVSGHAAGIDETAHETALAVGGTTTVVLAEGLLRFSPRRGLRDADDESLLLVSGFNPTAKWTVYQAMERNKWIAALSRAVIVVASDVRGGSWAQGMLCLETGKPLLVPDFPEEIAPGNRKLIEQGALPLDPGHPESQLEQFVEVREMGSTDDQKSLFA